MRSAWFETVAEAQRRARKRLPPSVYGALLAGTEKGLTLADNVAAFDELGFVPQVAGLPAGRDMATIVMGQPVALPVLISPTGVQAVHPDGEVAVARAAAARGTAMGLSSFASKPLAEVIAANPRTFFQLYWIGGRDQVAARIEQARAAGAAGLILTLDWSFAHRPGLGQPAHPGAAEPGRADPAGPGRPAPAPLAARLRADRPAAGADRAEHGRARPAGPGVLRRLRGLDAPRRCPAGTTSPGWRAVAGPVMLKGVSRVDDARRAVDAGLTAISVSNHGGNNLDGTPATIRLLPDIAAAVGGQVEVLLDGGIRRGGDVVKALALGARAVMIGRAYLWGLAADGQAGVENVLDIMRGGIDSALLALGHASIAGLSPADMLVPPGFTRRHQPGSNG